MGFVASFRKNDKNSVLFSFFKFNVFIVDFAVLWSSFDLQYCRRTVQNFVEPSFCVTKRTFSERQNLFIVILRMGKL